MQQLSGLDAAFLAMETPSVFGHVGSICVLDPSTSPEPLTLDRLTTIIESRLHLIPPFRRRLVEVPLGLDQPYWIEDPDFDIEYHVRELALPDPGDDRQLAEQAARLHARALDRRRPLWELYLIHGLKNGRKAIYSKVHHAAIDGVSGNDILGAVLDRSPEGRPAEDAPPWTCDEQPGAVSMLVRSAVSLTGHPLRAARMSYGLLRAVPTLAATTVRPRLPVIDRLLGRDSGVVLSSTGLRAPATPFNRSVSPHRRWAFVSLPFADVKRVKDATPGMTVNDVVMALSAGALRSWLLDHDALPTVPLVAAVPVSVRTDAQKGTGGNRISSMIAALPTHLPDPAARLAACHEAMRAAKEQHGALPADVLADVAQFAMPALAGQAARLAARLRIVERVNAFNLIISNVPGPNVPLYYAGAELVAYYPLSAIADGQGLNITVMSYGGQLHFGLIADRDLVPDVDVMAGYLAAELRALSTAQAA
ncbi:MAG TPA: wax ester/triacylglycerol synthase family O-acyltransferase [Mycobacteriales bacterium]|jgi:WS/DGAT/MGAT family acyltransferase|nr:wax ester/triacylglycerol synthase family O-acyltransferase [Mycobacteriales bacterium]